MSWTNNSHMSMSVNIFCLLREVEPKSSEMEMLEGNLFRIKFVKDFKQNLIFLLISSYFFNFLSVSPSLLILVKVMIVSSKIGKQANKKLFSHISSLLLIYAFNVSICVTILGSKSLFCSPITPVLL